MNDVAVYDDQLLEAGKIDFQYFVNRRKVILAHVEDMPKYLLLPEINQILSVALNDTHHFLFNTLWHTGARISEALLLTVKDFELDELHPYVSVPKLNAGAGRPGKNSRKTAPRRLIGVYDQGYIMEARRFFASHKFKSSEPIFSITRRTAGNWLDKLVNEAEKDRGESFSIEISTHTFRHSFAVNSVLHGTDVVVLQGWLGHRDRQSTEIYTKILSSETAFLMQRISFS